MKQDEMREVFKLETERRLQELAEFMARWKDLPAQRSKQWHDDRTFSIGASEIATLLKGLDPYKTIRTMIGSKAGLIPFGDKRAVNWGCVLERVITMYAEIIFDCHIEEMGSIPTAGMRHQRSSPDGVAVVPCLGNKIVSFEFKAPKNRIPNGNIPQHYRPQVLTCLCAVEPADLGIFIDVALRRCAVADWRFDSSAYCLEYHNDVDFDLPSAMTIVYFYAVPNTDGTANVLPEDEPVEAYTSGDSGVDELIKMTSEMLIHARANVEAAPDEKKVEELLTIADRDARAERDAKEARLTPRLVGGALNLGECPPALFDAYLARVCEHRMRVEYGRIVVAADTPANFEAEIAGRNGCIGILPLKIMRCVICPVKKDPSYVAQFQPLIDRIIPTIHKIVDAPETERFAVYERECDMQGWTEVPRVWGGKK